MATPEERRAAKKALAEGIVQLMDQLDKDDIPAIVEQLQTFSYPHLVMLLTAAQKLKSETRH